MGLRDGAQEFMGVHIWAGGGRERPSGREIFDNMGINDRRWKEGVRGRVSEMPSSQRKV